MIWLDDRHHLRRAISERHANSRGRHAGTASAGRFSLGLGASLANAYGSGFLPAALGGWETDKRRLCRFASLPHLVADEFLNLLFRCFPRPGVQRVDGCSSVT